MTAAKRNDPKGAAPRAGEKPIELLDPARVCNPGFGWTSHEATVPVDTRREALLSSRFWRRVSPKLRRGDHIRWRNDALTEFGELVVIASDVATGALELRELWTRDVAPAALAESERCGFSVRDLGVHEKFAIIRDADGATVAKDIPSYDQAMRRIRTEFVPNMALAAAAEARSAS